MFPRKKFEHVWEGVMTPFRIVGNVYFCGTYPASAHLIDTGDGLILIDPGYLESAALVVDSIYRLGFDPKNIRYIVNTHWHGDHTAATAAMVALTGAKTLIGEADAEKSRRYFMPVDMLIRDGDRLTLGNTTIRFVHTPGHTAGTVSLFFDTEENGTVYRVGMFGGAGANTLVPDKYDYPDARAGYRSSLARLRQEKVDVMLGNHVWNNDTEEKGRILLETGENRFLDSALWGKFLDHCEKRLDKLEKAE